MIDWIKALEQVECNFDNEGQGGSKSYNDTKFGEIDFQWHANKSKLTITWYSYEPICICGKGFLDVDCDCEWDAFGEGDPFERVFTKKQVNKLKQPTLF